jgi:hypothetical protein
VGEARAARRWFRTGQGNAAAAAGEGKQRTPVSALWLVSLYVSSWSGQLADVGG